MTRLDELEGEVFDLGSASIHYLKGLTTRRAKEARKGMILLVQGLNRYASDQRTWRVTGGWWITPSGSKRELELVGAGWERLYFAGPIGDLVEGTILQKGA